MPVPLILPPSEARRVLLDAALCEACPTLRQIAATATFKAPRVLHWPAPFSGDAA